MLGTKSFGEKFAKRLEEVAQDLYTKAAAESNQNTMNVINATGYTLTVLAQVVREVTG